jgi:lipid-binding SYLF domain-containing protein
MEATVMQIRIFKSLLALLAVFAFVPAHADEYVDAVKVFQDAGESGAYFKKAYGYALFPSIGKAGAGIGGAHGSGRVYEKGAYVGDAKMTQLTFGLQLGGQAYSQIIFFETKKAFDDFTSGNFEFGAQATATALTASASAEATTTGTGAGASSKASNATTAGAGYQNGMAVFTVAKGGLMYEATIGGQKFSYKPNK